MESLKLLLRKIRIALTPPCCWLTTRLENGALVSGLSRAGHGGRGIYLWRDDYEPELRHLDAIVKTGDVFMDIGANSGAFSMKAAKIVGASGIVVSLEPFPEMIRTLWRNVRLNRYDHARIRQCVVSDALGETRFWMNRNLPNSFSLNKEDETAQAFSVLSVRVDDVVGWERLPRLDYIKIDAEGAEEAILRGAADSIRRFRPVIQLEVTLADAPVPEGYQRFRYAEKANVLLLPTGHPAIPEILRRGAEAC